MPAARSTYFWKRLKKLPGQAASHVVSWSWRRRDPLQWENSKMARNRRGKSWILPLANYHKKNTLILSWISDKICTWKVSGVQNVGSKRADGFRSPGNNKARSQSSDSGLEGSGLSQVSRKPNQIKNQCKAWNFQYTLSIELLGEARRHYTWKKESANRASPN